MELIELMRGQVIALIGALPTLIPAVAKTVVFGIAAFVLGGVVVWLWIGVIAVWSRHSIKIRIATLIGGLVASWVYYDILVLALQWLNVPNPDPLIVTATLVASALLWCLVLAATKDIAPFFFEEVVARIKAEV